MLEYRLEDYSLTCGQACQSIFVSEYGLRHIQQGKLEQGCRAVIHWVIGIVELIPLLGLLGSLIERICALVDDKFNSQTESSQTESSQTQSSQSTGLDPSRVTLIEKTWHEKLTEAEKIKAKFKSDVLAFFKERPSAPRVKAPIKISEAQKKDLREAVLHYKQNHAFPDSVKVIQNNSNCMVFEIPSIPKVIFKADFNNGNKLDNPYKYRLEATQKAHEVCENEHLDLLHTPLQELVTVELEEGKKMLLLAEEKFDLVHGSHSQRALFEFCCQDPELKPFMIEIVKQLTILIIETGFVDVKYDNIPFLLNGWGIGLIDMGTSDSPIRGLLEGYSNEVNGLLNYLTPELLEEVIPILEKRLTPEQLQKINLPELKKQRQQAFEQSQRIAEHQKNVKEFPFVNPLETEVAMQTIQKSAHRHVLKDSPLAISLRRFCVSTGYDFLLPTLNLLKQTKTIADHEPENPHAGAWTFIYV